MKGRVIVVGEIEYEIEFTLTSRFRTANEGKFLKFFWFCCTLSLIVNHKYLYWLPASQQLSYLFPASFPSLLTWIFFLGSQTIPRKVFLKSLYFQKYTDNEETSVIILYIPVHLMIIVCQLTLNFMLCKQDELHSLFGIG